jgi:hypothetical protein
MDQTSALQDTIKALQQRDAHSNQLQQQAAVDQTVGAFCTCH